MTQRQLAERLQVNETMVSRDERNEYHGITVDRANRVLDALGVRLVTRVEVEPMPVAEQPRPQQSRRIRITRREPDSPWTGATS